MIGTGDLQRRRTSGTAGGSTDHVTVRLSEQVFALPIAYVHDVFEVGALTRVPQAPPDVAGLLNLRGRIVTAIDLRRRLGLPEADRPAVPPIAVGIDLDGEPFCLLVDAVGEILRLDPDRQDTTIHLGEGWAGLALGIQDVADELVVILDTAALLDPAVKSSHPPAVRPLP